MKVEENMPFLDLISNTKDEELKSLLKSEDAQLIEIFNSNIEGLWRKYEDYLGNKNSLERRNFLNDCNGSKYHARFWEMYLTCALVNLDFTPKEKPEKGPDICLQNPTIHIEAVTATDGNINKLIKTDEVQGQTPWMPQIGSFFGVDNEKIILRFSNANQGLK